jgi:hypothetical protein
MAIPSGAGIYLVRVTTDDREHQLWVAAAASQDEAINLVLRAVPEGWTAAPLSNKLKPAEIEALNMTAGEVRELTLKRSNRAPRTN